MVSSPKTYETYDSIIEIFAKKCDGLTSSLRADCSD